MKVLHLCILALFVLMRPIAGLADNHALETKKVELSSMNGLSVSQGIKVTVVRSGGKNYADVQSNYLDQVVLEVKNSILHVYYLNQTNLKLSNPDTKILLYVSSDLEKFLAGSSAEINVDRPVACVGLETKVAGSAELHFLKPVKVSKAYLETSSSGDLIFAELRSDVLIISASSSGSMKFGNAKTQKLVGQISSSAEVKINGTAISADIKASSSGDFMGKAFSVSKLNASAASSGSIAARVMEVINATAASSGKINYHSDKNIEVHKEVHSGGEVSPY